MTSTLTPRNNKATPPPLAPIATFGPPGVPFIESLPVSPIFSQGEDVIFDGVFYVNCIPVTPSNWVISVPVKTNPHNFLNTWLGTLGDGIFFNSSTGVYTIWIPGSVTRCWFAGSYIFDVVVRQPVGTGIPRDITSVLLTQWFNIEYTASSPFPETDSMQGHGVFRPCLDPSTPPSITAYENP